MIDPANITNYDRSEAELQELLIFAICVQNKQSKRIAPAVDTLLSKPLFRGNHLENIRLFVRAQGIGALAQQLHSCGITPHNQKAGFLHSASLSKLELSECSLEDLMEIKGVSHKTAHFFLTHSREGYDYPILDTHILKFLRDCGVEKVPMATPQSPKRYKELAEEFLRHVPDGCSVADYDLFLWRKYSGNT